MSLNHLIKQIQRIKTPLILILIWLAVWGVRDGLLSITFIIGFIGISVILSHIIAKEMFATYNWNAGERLNQAWHSENEVKASLAKAFLFMRTVIFIAVMLTTAILVFVFFGGKAFGQTKEQLQILKEEHKRIWSESDITIFAGQIKAESSWKETAVRVEPSGVISMGLMQVLDVTYNDMKKRYPTLLDAPEYKMLTAKYAIRAGILYDKEMYNASPCNNDRYYYMLRSYNGGLGNMKKEVRLASSCEPARVEKYCKRSAQSCKINIEYPYKVFKYADTYKSILR
ncbi:MAG TPA: lytic transglycosylase domain-containing protein [Thermodesulfovibrio thiophilus]|nr:lytic transglycosylase domain-containing protein [Thermodesulfovibrio thiophilus]